MGEKNGTNIKVVCGLDIVQATTSIFCLLDCVYLESSRLSSLLESQRLISLSLSLQGSPFFQQTSLRPTTSLSSFQESASPFTAFSTTRSTRQAYPQVFIRMFTSSSAGAPSQQDVESPQSASSAAAAATAQALRGMPQQFPDLEFSTNRYELDRHGHGESYHPTQAPGLVVYCQSTEQVQQAMQYCVRHSIPMVPFGAGTSAEGQVQAVQPNTLSIDVAKYMTQIHIVPDPSATAATAGTAENDNNISDDKSITTLDAYAVVDAGVTRLQLQAALKHSGYLFSVDPGADATLGGMAATGASGTTTVKWGTMADNVLGLTAVLATDETAPIVQTGCRALKNSAGYDLTSLLCGSEGTLGVITQVTVQLHPVPAYVVAVSCAFPTLMAAAQAVSTLLQCNVDMMRCELLDATSMQVFASSTHNTDDNDDSNSTTTAADNKDDDDNSNKPTLFLELAAVTETALQEQVELVRELLQMQFEEAADATNNETELSFELRLAYEQQERNELWKARHDLYYQAINSGMAHYKDEQEQESSGGDNSDADGAPAGARALATDACVPLSQLAHVLVGTAKDVAQAGVMGPCFSHAGDGNFHCILPIPAKFWPPPPSSSDEEPDLDLSKDDHHRRRIQERTTFWNKLRRIQDNLVRRALAVGGTCTGEHGIGLSKRKYMQQQYTPETIQTMKLIKRALDPRDLMNPGKVFL